MDKKHPQPKKSSKFPKLFFIFGSLVLVAGAGLFISKIITAPATEDAEFLVSSGEWVREDQPSVIWNFTEIGKGHLTTDHHATDYNFTWAMEENKLTLTTDWLSELNDEFSYTLDQGAKVLTIKTSEGSTEIKFKAE